MKVYTDVSQLPLVEEAARLPSFKLLKNDSNLSTQLSTHAEVVSGQVVSPAGATSHSELTLQVTDDVAFGHKKTADVVSGGFFKMERAKRLELSIGSLASQNRKVFLVNHRRLRCSSASL